MAHVTDLKIAFIGFGEAAQAFLQGWREESFSKDLLPLNAFDIKTDNVNPQIVSAKEKDFTRSKVNGMQNVKQAIHGADVIFSLVTADQAHLAAKSAAQHILKNAFYFDCNSCAPGTKKRSADVIEAAGARYVDVSIMAPVHPKLHKTPIALRGPHAKKAVEIFNTLQMAAEFYSEKLGASSSLKMVRSIMIKGMEALMAECVLAGRLAGVEEDVIDSLDKSYPGFDFKTKSSYMLERSMTHGIRRAAEMREVAVTVEELGLNAHMSHAIVEWQQRIGDLGIITEEDDTYQDRTDTILDALNLKK